VARVIVIDGPTRIMIIYIHGEFVILISYYDAHRILCKFSKVLEVGRRWLLSLIYRTVLGFGQVFTQIVHVNLREQYKNALICFNAMQRYSIEAEYL